MFINVCTFLPSCMLLFSCPICLLLFWLFFISLFYFSLLKSIYIHIYIYIYTQLCIHFAYNYLKLIRALRKFPRQQALLHTVREADLSDIQFQFENSLQLTACFIKASNLCLSIHPCVHPLACPSVHLSVPHIV